ncbi:hypothetical protein MHBO_000987 [Bonamia ostreae]|uniref:Uncharacterized protein n=1 Tax=Bonamia ostreae TaxID=126728 RepID=A0ABV2AHN5_9EUKA
MLILRKLQSNKTRSSVLSRAYKKTNSHNKLKAPKNVDRNRSPKSELLVNNKIYAKKKKRIIVDAKSEKSESENSFIIPNGNWDKREKLFFFAVCNSGIEAIAKKEIESIPFLSRTHRVSFSKICYSDCSANILHKIIKNCYIENISD